jgi:hypothetical protein
MGADFGPDSWCSKSRRAFRAFLFTTIFTVFYEVSFIGSFTWNKSLVVGNWSGNPSDAVVHNLQCLCIVLCSLGTGASLPLNIHFLPSIVECSKRKETIRFEIRNRTFLSTTALVWSRYSDWLRAGRPRGRSSSRDMVKNFSRIFTSSCRPYRLWGHPASHLMRAGGKVSGPWSWPLKLVPRSRKCESIHPLPPTPSWRNG